jgi:hypothetical protein
MEKGAVLTSILKTHGAFGYQGVTVSREMKASLKFFFFKIRRLLLAIYTSEELKDGFLFPAWKTKMEPVIIISCI